MNRLKKLQLLSEIYPTIAKASAEIINLQSIINLPKGTEHFITDIHGEYDSFSHVLKNGSGSVAIKIEEVFGHTLSESDKSSLATLIYYPKEKMEIISKTEKNMSSWYKITLYRLIEICKRVTSKYSRAKVRKFLPEDFAYIIEELITEKYEVQDKEAYYEEIVNTIIRIKRAKEFIASLSELIQRLVIDHLHILGDVYDRGPEAVKIMDTLCNYHSVDVQWGNHDIVWVGAAAGQTSCIANVIRVTAKYGNLDTLEVGYGIHLLPLATFAIETYKEDPCTRFSTKENSSRTKAEIEVNRKIHKAISIIQFKLEGQLISENPDFNMSDRNFLHLIDYENNIVKIGEKSYPLLDNHFPTIDPNDPYKLTPEEESIVARLQSSFENSEKLHTHAAFLLNNGSLYKVHNNNLLFHGCVPMTEDGDFAEVKIFGRKYKGKKLYDFLDSYARKGFFSVKTEEKNQGKDILWWIWCNQFSPLYGKDKMTHFERYFIEDPKMHIEKKNYYYTNLEDEVMVDKILTEFALDPKTAHIINGHVPVMSIKGESPVKCGGKVLVIDGGFAKAYQKVTGIAGYTLIFNSKGLILVAHEPFTSAEEAINHENDIVSQTVMIEKMPVRLTIGDTDAGIKYKERIEELEELLKAYRHGEIIPGASYIKRD